MSLDAAVSFLTPGKVKQFFPLLSSAFCARQCNNNNVRVREIGSNSDAAPGFALLSRLYYDDYEPNTANAEIDDEPSRFFFFT